MARIERGNASVCELEQRWRGVVISQEVRLQNGVLDVSVHDTRVTWTVPTELTLAI